MSEKSSNEDLSQIPMADEEIDSDEHAERNNLSTSNSTPRSNGLGGHEDDFHHPSNLSLSPPISLLDTDLTQEEQEEKARLIAQVLELQNTLDDLSARVDNVKEENLRLRSENQVLGQYIENLMAASSVFQPANEQPKTKRK